MSKVTEVGAGRDLKIGLLSFISAPPHPLRSVHHPLFTCLSDTLILKLFGRVSMTYLSLFWQEDISVINN